MHFDDDCKPRHQPQACRSKAEKRGRRILRKAYRRRTSSRTGSPSRTHIAKFVANLGSQIKPEFAQVLMTCDAQGLN
jgi:hypothetical protein